MRAYIITREKEVEVVEVSGEKAYFTWKENAYKINFSDVKLRQKGKRVNPEAEAFYVEGCALPLTSYIEKGEWKGDIGILDEAVVANALENVTSIQGEGISGWFRKAFDFLSSPKAITAFFTILIIVMVVIGFVTGEFKLG